MTTASEHRTKAAQADARAAKSFERCDTDGFLTQWASGLTGQLERMKADLIDEGGLHEFAGLYEGDRRVKAKIVTYQNKFSYNNESSWLLHEDETALIELRGGKFVPTGERSRVQKRLGLRERREVAPAYAFMNGCGTGLSGSAWPAIARANPDDWGADAELVNE